MSRCPSFQSTDTVPEIIYIFTSVSSVFSCLFPLNMIFKPYIQTKFQTSLSLWFTYSSISNICQKFSLCLHYNVCKWLSVTVWRWTNQFFGGVTRPQTFHWNRLPVNNKKVSHLCLLVSEIWVWLYWHEWLLFIFSSLKAVLHDGVNDTVGGQSAIREKRAISVLSVTILDSHSLSEHWGYMVFYN